MVGLEEEVNSYSDFVDHLESTTHRFVRGRYSPSEDAGQLEMLLNGTNAKAVTKYLDAEHRKDNGIFFTCEKLSEIVAKRLKNDLTQGKSVCDPTCGAGDLLLACTKFMPQKSTVAKTLSYWSSRIYGQDLYGDFVRSARSRLVLSGISQAKPHKANPIRARKAAYFENIITADLFENHALIPKADCIVTNPPYGHTDLTGKVTWGSGKGQLAALFLDHIVKLSTNGQRIVAILPDVLRSGSRYGKWRAFINQNASNLSIETYGRFNNEADVDVFILDFIVFKERNKEHNTSFENYADNELLNTVSDIFDVSVGPVVPHRDGEDGASSPYIDVISAGLWKEVVPQDMRNFSCTLKKPPFVVLRRTSSPSDDFRLKAALIRGREEVAVENHLIVLEPKDGKLSTCRRFLKIAQTDDANSWVNKKIRCRHLTVRAIREMPSFGLES